MSDASSSIDPKRPWIDDPADAPARMNWFATLLWPFGETSRVHFTRALVVLFFAGCVGAVMMFGAMGDGSSYPNAMVFVGVITLMSFAAHARRFASARRSALFAGIVLLPMVLSLAAFVAVASGSIEAANRELAQYEADLADPAAARERKLAEAQERRAAAAAAAEAGDEQPQRGRGRGGEEAQPGYKEGVFSPTRFVLQRAGPPAVMAWMVSGFIVFLWTLLWVARLPNGGGTIKARLAEMDAAQAPD